MERAKELLLNSALLMFVMFLVASALAIAPSTAWATEEADTVVYWGVEGDPYSLTLHLSPTPNSVCTQSENLDAIGWTSTPWYSYKDSVTSVVVDDDFSPSTCAYWFQDMKVLQYFDLDKLDTSKATSMAHMFRGCAGWIGGNIDETTHESLIWVGLDLSKFDTSSATDLSGMFATVTAWKSDFNSQMANWDVSHVENMSTMFLQAGIDIVLPDDYCYSCFCPDVSNWNTPALINASNMFAGCPSTSFTTIDLSNWTFDNVTDVSSMFSDDSSLTTIYAASDLDWSANSKITSHAGAFSGCSSLAGSAGTVYDSAHSDKSYGRVDGGVDAPGYFSTRPPSSGEGIAVEANLTFNHVLNASTAANITGITYRIDIAPHVLDAVPEPGAYEVPSAATAAMGELTATTFVPATDTAAAGSTEWEKTYTASKTFEQVFGSASNFGHAGVYLFDVSETVSGGSSSDAAKWSWTSAAGQAAPERYLVRIYVENGQSGLEYAYATISQLDSNGQEQANDAGKVSSLGFSSQYTATQTLVISKEVEGSFGNQSYPFPFEVTLYLPEWVEGAPADNVQNAGPTFEPSEDIVSLDVTELVFTSEEWAVPQAGDPSSKKVVGTANIADGQGVVLTVPVGTRYKVDERSSVAGSSDVLDAAGIPYDVGMEWSVGTITQQVDKVDSQGGSFVVGPAADAVDDAGVGAGEMAYVVCTPDTGYRLVSVTVTGETSGTVIPATVDGNIASFVMPAEPVSVEPVFEKIDYELSASPATANGTFLMARSADAAVAAPTAQYGDDVYIIADPDDGYALADATVTGDVSGNDVATALIGDDKARFTMPAEPVSAEVAFEKADFALSSNAATVEHGSFALKSDPSGADAISTAQIGDTVYVVAAPDAGYVLGSVTITGATTNQAVVPAIDGNTASFTMIADDVGITVSFAKADLSLASVLNPQEAHGSIAFKAAPDAQATISTAQMGDAVYIVATPDTGYRLASIAVTGTNSSTPVAVTVNGNTASFTMPAEAVSASAVFEAIGYSLTKSPADNGSFALSSSPSGTPEIATATYGQAVYIIASPAQNYEIASVSVNGSAIEPSGGAYSFPMPAGDAGVAVAFRGVASTLVKANADNGSFVVGRTADAASDATDVRYNDVLYVIPTPDANYEVASVTVNGTSIAAEQGAYRFTAPANSTTVAVSFQGVAATVSKSPTSNGSFVVGRTADAASDATDTRYNDILYIVPSPAANYEVASVTVNGAPLVASGGSYSFNLPAGNSTVAVSFAGIPATITKSQTSHGSFVVGRTTNAATDATDTRYNDTLYIVPTPDANYEVESVTVNGSPISASGGSYSFDLPASGATVAVSFRGVSATVTKSATSNGSFIVGNSSSATSDAANTRYNDTLYVIPSPHTGYQVSSITVNGAPIAASGGSYSFSLPASGATVAVSFSPIIYSVSKDTAQNGSFIVDDAATPVADITQASYASTVYVSVAPATGYQIDQVKATGLTSGQATSIAISNGKGSFTMPAEAVRVSATFTKVNYSIMRATTTNGSFVVGDSALTTTNLATAQYGDTVYVNGAPNTGYQVSQIQVTGGTSGTVTNLTVSNNKASFAMPAEAVTVSVTFAKVNYSLTPSSTSNGSFVLSSASSGTPTITTAQYGDTVYVKTTPSPGFKVDTVTISPSATVMTVTENSVYRFEMPASSTSVNVTFVSAGPASQLGAQVVWVDTTNSDLCDINLSSLKTMADDVAANHPNGNGTSTSAYMTTVNSYMTNDVSFIFSDDPNVVPMEYRIIGVNHDIDNGETGLTFMAKRALDKGFWMNPTNSNTGGWASSALRAELNPENANVAYSLTDPNHIYQLLPPSLRDTEANGGAKTVVKYSNDGKNVLPVGQYGKHLSQDRFWVISNQELTGSENYDITGSVNTQYQFFVGKVTSPIGANVAIKSLHQTISGSSFSKAPTSASGINSILWWQRSASSSNQTNFMAVVNDGRPNSISSASYALGVLPCFCMGPTSTLPTRSSTSSYTYANNDSSQGPSRILAVGPTGDLTLGELKEISADLAANATGNGSSSSIYMSQVQDYMDADVSFVFEDDPNPVPMEYRIIDVNHNISDNEIGLTFMAKKALDKGFWMNSTATNIGGWEASALRTELNQGYSVDYQLGDSNHIYQLLPPSLRAADGARSVTKHSNDGLGHGGKNANHATQDRFWVASYQEICGDTRYDISDNVNTQYKFFYDHGVIYDSSTSTGHPLLVSLNRAINGAAIQKSPSAAVNDIWDWWIRSTSCFDSEALQIFSSSGTWDTIEANRACGILPCFCL